MAQQYEATQDEERRATPPPFLAPVAHETAQPIRKMPIKTERVDLSGDYEGWWAVVRTNAPLSVMLDLQAINGDESKLEDVVRAIPSLVVRWNFVDTEGEPIPVNLASARSLPLDLFKALMDAFGEKFSAAIAVPKD